MKEGDGAKCMQESGNATVRLYFTLENMTFHELC